MCTCTSTHANSENCAQFWKEEFKKKQQKIYYYNFYSSTWLQGKHVKNESGFGCLQKY